MNIDTNNFFIRRILNIIQHYNHKKYWKMRNEVINPKSGLPVIIRAYYLLLIKRMDSFNNSSMGTDLGKGAIFKTPPKLPHGLNGIIVNHSVIIGENCTIYQQVTITRRVTIGDNCLIGAGAKILNEVSIGNNVNIGANAVVVNDIPDNCTAVGIPAMIIHK